MATGAMRALLIVVSLLVAALPIATPVAAKPIPDVDGECVWVINGPTIFSRYCVEPEGRKCRVYHEQWYWEGGYSKTCYL
jgi:hypothetical protein